MVPAEILSLGDNHPYILLASLNDAQLHLFERKEAGLALVESLPISMGKAGIGKQVEGDKKTPVGLYRVTSYLNDEQLDEFYGDAAYPVDYPNLWDRRKGRTGSGIWLHSMPDGVNERPTFDSDGCVVVNNQQIAFLEDFIDVGQSKMILTDNMTWLTRDQWQQQSEEINEAVTAWQSAWESLDPEKYLSHYSREFNDGQRNFNQWAEYKTRVNSAKRFIEVDIDKISAFNYPGEPGLYVVEFYQTYRSSNYQWQGWKKQYWQRQGGRLQIIYEGNR
jgi:murein L,D-transpeptidase YafK